MNTKIIIREAQDADRPALEECMAELQAFELSIELNRVPPEAIRGRYLDELFANCAKSDGAIFIAELNGRVIGFVCIFCRVDSEEMIELHREHAYVSDLVVLAPFRRLGVGAQLMHAAESRARSQGAQRILVGVLAANSAALQLYHALGYADREIVLEKPLDGGANSI